MYILYSSKRIYPLAHTASFELAFMPVYSFSTLLRKYFHIVLVLYCDCLLLPIIYSLPSLPLLLISNFVMYVRRFVTVCIIVGAVCCKEE